MAKDYYQLLGVSRSASDKEVRQAYRRLARKYHPDVNRGDKGAEARFKEINEAYQVLSNADSRKKYNAYGDQWRHADSFQQAGAGWPFRSGGFRSRRGRAGPGPGVDLGDTGGFGGLFGDLFGFGRSSRTIEEEVLRPEPIQVPTTITLEEAYRGATRIVQLPPDPLTGAPGRRLEVKVPPGVGTNSKVHVANNGPARERRGEFYLVVSIASHKQFERRGDDLRVTVPVHLADAVLGGEVSVPTIKGSSVVLKLPPETQNGRTFKLKGQGMPNRKTPTRYGDLLATVKVVLPTGLNQEEQGLFQRLRELHSG